MAKRPDHYMGHAALGLILQGRGEVEAAILEFRAARRCYPHFVEGEDNPYRGEATCCFSLGRMDEGIAALRALCEQNGLDTQARIELARALRDQGKASGALAVLDDALFGDVTNAAVHRLRADILADQKRPEDRAAALGLGSHAAPKDLEAALTAAGAWLELGKPEQAKPFRTRAKALKPQDPRVLELDARLK